MEHGDLSDQFPFKQSKNKGRIMIVSDYQKDAYIQYNFAFDQNVDIHQTGVAKKKDTQFETKMYLLDKNTFQKTGRWTR